MKGTIQIEVPKNAKIMVNGVEYKPESKPAVWRPQDGEDCFLLGSNGSADDWAYEGDDHDQKSYAQGNVFKTREDAELVAKRRKLRKEFQDFIAEINAQEGWVADWEDVLQAKCHLVWNFKSDCAEFSTRNYIAFEEKPMHGCKKAIEQAQNKFKNDLKLIITGEE